MEASGPCKMECRVLVPKRRMLLDRFDRPLLYSALLYFTLLTPPSLPPSSPPLLFSLLLLKLIETAFLYATTVLLVEPDFNIFISSSFSL